MTQPNTPSGNALASVEARIRKIADWLASNVQSGQSSYDEPPEFRTEFDMQLADAATDLRAIATEIATQPATAGAPVDARTHHTHCSYGDLPGQPCNCAELYAKESK